MVPDRRSTWILSITVVFIALGLTQIIPAARRAAVDRNGDLSRQWLLLQYVMRGVNPYPIAFDALHRTYGVLAPRGPVHLKDVSISEIPRLGPHPLTDLALGPPEATYPPQSLVVLLPLGLLPRASLVFIWLGLIAANQVKILICIVSTQLILLCTMSLMVHETPCELIVGWLSVAAYFRAGGAYTVRPAHDQRSALGWIFLGLRGANWRSAGRDLASNPTGTTREIWVSCPRRMYLDLSRDV